MPWSPRKVLKTNFEKMSRQQLEKKYVELEPQAVLRDKVARELIKRYNIRSNGDPDMRNDDHVRDIGGNHYWRYDQDIWDKFIEKYLIGLEGGAPVMINRPDLHNMNLRDLVLLYEQTKKKVYLLLEKLKERNIDPYEMFIDYTSPSFVEYDEKAFEEHVYLLNDIADILHSHSLSKVKQEF